MVDEKIHFCLFKKRYNLHTGESDLVNKTLLINTQGNSFPTDNEVELQMGKEI